MLRRYVHGPGIDEPIVWYEGAGTSDRRYLITDHQGSVIAENGASTTRYSYGPYGEPNTWSGSRFRYTGQAALQEVSLYHYKARVYDPVLGRFLQTDPVGYQEDNNLYAYVGNDPLNRSDPTGLSMNCGQENPFVGVFPGCDTSFQSTGEGGATEGDAFRPSANTGVRFTSRNDAARAATNEILGLADDGEFCDGVECYTKIFRTWFGQGDRFYYTTIWAGDEDSGELSAFLYEGVLGTTFLHRHHDTNEFLSGVDVLTMGIMRADRTHLITPDNRLRVFYRADLTNLTPEARASLNTRVIDGVLVYYGDIPR